MKKLLVTGALKKNDALFEELSSMGYDILFVQNEKDPLPEEAYGADAIICNGLFLYHGIEKFANLKTIHLTSAGFDRVPMDYISSHGIRIFNARGVYSIPMAEFALFGVLSLMKEGRFFYENQKKKEWVKHRGLSELFSKRVLIVGAGNVGTECAKRFSAFGTHTVGIDLYPRCDENYEYIAPLSSLKDELCTADVVVLTLPLTEETRGLFGKDAFAVMKKGAILVNIARGAVIDEKELVAALDNGTLSGAVLDVFCEEPLSDANPLWLGENVIITPHNSFVSDGNEKRLCDLIINNFKGEQK